MKHQTLVWRHQVNMNIASGASGSLRGGGSKEWYRALCGVSRSSRSNGSNAEGLRETLITCLAAPEVAGRLPLHVRSLRETCGSNLYGSGWFGSCFEFSHVTTGDAGGVILCTLLLQLDFQFQSVLYDLPAIASARHLQDIIDLVSFNTRAAFKWTWLIISIFYNCIFPDRL